ncbi:MAG: IS630 transposase-related protein [Candidatus Poribacteria bacterium]|nr:IS630 transposase-related protein [Candidatus Poribacteria bacterium]
MLKLAGKSETFRLFTVARSTIDRWLAAENPFAIRKTVPKNMRVIDEKALRKHVADFPDLTQKERAAHFKVSEFCIGYGLRKLGITRKKTLGYKQRCDEKRATYRQELTVKEAEDKSTVYLDECGFCAESFRTYAYAQKGNRPLA